VSFFEECCPNKNQNNNMSSDDIGSVPDPKKWGIINLDLAKLI